MVGLGLIDPYENGLSGGFADPFTMYLGPPPSLGKISPFGKKPQGRYTLPDAYRGESEVLSQTTLDLTFTANYTFYTERIMPWKRNDQLNYTFEKTEYNPALMGVTPHLAMSQLVSSQSTVHTVSLIRRGIAHEFELNFVETDKGRRNFAATILQFSNSFQETANVECVRSLLGCQRLQEYYQRKFKVIKPHDLEDYWNRQTERFMAVQKSNRGFNNLSVQIDEDVHMCRGTTDTWLIHPKVLQYVDSTDVYTLHKYGGDEAVNRLQGRNPDGTRGAANTNGALRSAGPDGVVGQNDVYVVRSYVTDNAGPIDLLSRDEEIGVFNTMEPATKDWDKYSTADWTTKLYDNKQDDWAFIELAEAYEQCILFDAEGRLRNPFVGGRGRASGNLVPNTVEYDNDFLNNVNYIGDMGPRWLKTAQLEQAGRTLYNAILRAKPSVAGMLGYRNQTERNNVAAVPAVGADGREQYLELFSEARNILGTDSLFFAGQDKDLGRVFQAFVKANGGEPAKFLGSEVVGAAAPAAEFEDKHQKMLVQTLGSVVPAAHKGELERIASNASQDWRERAGAVQELVLRAIREDPSSVSALRDENHVKEWFDKVVKSHASHMAKATPQRSGVAPVAATAVPVEIALNGPLTPVCPTSVRDFVGLRSGSDAGGAAASVVSRRPAQVGAATEFRGPRLNAAFEDADLVNIDAHIANIAAGSAPLVIKWLAILFLGARLTKQRLLAFCTHNVYPLLKPLLLRPHATYKTSTGIKVKAGGVGNMLVGHASMMVDTEAARMNGLLHWVTYLGGVVENPENVYVQHSMYCHKYLGGMDVSFWSVDEYKTKGVNRRSKSIICTLLPPTLPDGQKKLAKMLDIRGRWYTEYEQQWASPEDFSKPCYPGGARTAAIMQWWDPVHKSRMADNSARSTSVRMNFVCFQGVQFNALGDVTIEQGHMGENVYPGCGKVRNGQIQQLQAAGYIGKQGVVL